jgi:PAS domain S-box-containing protein
MDDVRTTTMDIEMAWIVASARDAIVGMTRSGEITSFNQAATQLFGFAESSVVGSPLQVLVPAAEQAREEAVLRRVLAGENIRRYRATRRHSDGGTVGVWTSVSPIRDADGVIVGIASMSHGLEDEAAALGAPSPVVADDADGVSHRPKNDQDLFQDRMEAEREKERVQIQMAQDRFQERMGVEREKERVEVQDAQDRFQKRMGLERDNERIQVQDAHDRFQVGMDAKQAREREHVQEAHDRFQVGMQVERAEAQIERDHLQTQLQQSQRLEVLGQLAGGVAHDFNNLLAVILNYAAFVAEEIAARPDEELAAAARDVVQIQRAAERAARLTHQLLAFARREVVKPLVLDLNDVVREVEQLLNRTIGEDVVLITDLADGLCPVLADTGQVEQVLMNLAVNARDAMGGGGTLTIETANIIGTMSGRDAGGVMLRVSDTGAGMSAGIAEHVFEPFYTTKADGSGTGLGLATVYGIVTQAGGTIRLKSREGVGTTFTIVLPVTDEVAVPVEAPAPFERLPQGETILVVEDEEALREVTERIFTRGGYRVITAASGVEALALAERHDGDIHLLVTDVVMPIMLGKEVAERIRAIKPGIEVLYMSGYARPVLASQGRLDRDVNLIEKPFSAETLVETAGRILNARA